MLIWTSVKHKQQIQYWIKFLVQKLLGYQLKAKW
jgi:hypothetical protein